MHSLLTQWDSWVQREGGAIIIAEARGTERRRVFVGRFVSRHEVAPLQ